MKYLPYFLAFVAGALSVLAFAPFSQPWISLIGLALLFHLWLGATPKRGFLSGLCFGLGLMGFGVSWVHNSIAQFGGVNQPLAWLITLGFVFALALYFGLAGWLSTRLARGKTSSLLLLFPAIWVLFEWLRGWLFNGFGWLSLGYSQIDVPLAGFAAVLGVYGVSLVLALSAALLSLWRSPWVLMLPFVWLGGWQLQQYDWSRPAGDAFRASLVQAAVPQELKWQPQQFKPTLKLYLELTDEQTDSRLIIWPETAIPAFSKYVESSFLQPLSERLAIEERDLLLGIPVQHQDDSYYNAMLSLGASGRDHYYKQHLVPFGEFMPLRFLLEPLINTFSIPMSEFTPGKAAQPLMTLAGYQAGISICYEDSFGNEVAKALPQAAFLVNSSNDAWFGDSLAPHQHLEIARMRALETSRYMLRATNTGVSAIIDHQGRLLTTSPQFRTAVLSADIQPLQGETMFARYGNKLVLILILSMLGLFAIISYRKKL
jgi:apolipoprotein N-acyltransferase